MNKTISVIATATAGVGSPFAGAPTWVTLAFLVTSFLLVVTDGLVTQFIRVRSSKADPVRAHRIERRRRRHGRR